MRDCQKETGGIGMKDVDSSRERLNNLVDHMAQLTDILSFISVAVSDISADGGISEKTAGGLYWLLNLVNKDISAAIAKAGEDAPL